VITPGKGRVQMAAQMHTHFSALSAVGVFLVVLIVGTTWRLAAYRLAASNNPMARNAGAAMSFQY
jgi:hypothetical protein